MRIGRTLIAGLAAAAFCGALAGGSAAQAQPRIAPADAQTTKIVAAAKAYVATLTPAQKAASMFAYRDAAQRTLWSNFPTGIVERKGVKWGDLNDTQRARLMDLLSAVLSAEGVKMMREQMDADDYLKVRNPEQNMPAGTSLTGPSGRPRGPLQFGADLYYAAFLGAPSATAPWMFQFGGHHLAINATVVGGAVTLAPSLTGGQPVQFDKDGKEIYVVAHEVGVAQALIDSLTADQRAKAVLAPRAIDMILGPGHDGQVLQPEGLQASAMTADQKAKLLSLIEVRIGLLNANDSAAAMAKIRANIDRTWFAWFGPTDRVRDSYFRVTGPTILMEFSPQDVTTTGNHLHNMYRDPTNDYGVAWAPIK